MAVTLRASEQGLEIVNLARKRRGWTKTADAWCQEALVGKAALRKFWRRNLIIRDNFVSICQAVGQNWEEIADLSLETQEEQIFNASWLLEFTAIVEEDDKPLIDRLIGELQKRSPSLKVETKKIILGSEYLAQNWQSEELLSPRTRSRTTESELPQGSIRRAKKIELGENQSVILVVQMIPELDENVAVTIWVEPSVKNIHLPHGLQVSVIDESENIVPELQDSVQRDAPFIKMEFSIELGEFFSIELTLEEFTVRENF
ncbi:MAG: DUF1822 family protein [Oscillatoria sp. PMC 1051.18]|nr:DUF1822 family protein [Oscillatoria sp. PMC 1050.18]MEC5029263.1 DUF1822 family protein [Oscillatoria sp. PMC 1051.18]